jgi:CcmD family protein
MSDWGWVAFAYSVAYLTVLGYTLLLALRLRRTRRRLEGAQ